MRAALLILAIVPYLVLWPDAGLDVLSTLAPGPLWRGHPSIPVVAITFDDGPDPVYTPQVLDILDRYNARATFFLVGERALQFPEIVAEIRRRGHLVGNHSYTWTPTRTLKAAAFEQDLLKAESALGLSGVAPRFFRPAGGVLFRRHFRVLKKHGYTTVLASNIAFDPYKPPASWIGFLAKRSVRPGAIIVLHDSGGDRSRTVKALPGILEAARKRSLDFVRIDQLRRR